MKYVGLMDCNNFFVSCERLFRPDLHGKPVAVLSSNDGCLVARSNEVKAMGIPMGLPLFQAKQLADMSEVTLFSSNFTLYRDISARVMKVLTDEVGECEIYSVDEAFFTSSSTVTEAELAELRARIIQKVGIPVSIGVASTKTLAKVGSEVGKKSGEGICLLHEEKWREISKEFLCGEVWNLGRATTAKLSEADVKTAAEFMSLDQAYVQKHFGVGGRRVQDELSGIAVHQVGVNSHDIQQSIMCTRSFQKSTNDQSAVESALSYHVAHAAEKLRQKGCLATRMFVIARAGRHSDFNLRTGSREVQLTLPTNETKVLIKHALEAFAELYEADVPYKKAGVVLSGLVPERFMQLDIFTEVAQKPETSIDRVMDAINSRFGNNTLRPAVILNSGPKTSAELRSQEYTTRWGDIPRVWAK